MVDRVGQVWEMGNGILFLVTGPPQMTREVLLEADSPSARDRRFTTQQVRRARPHPLRPRPWQDGLLDHALWHPILYLEMGFHFGCSEDYPGSWEKLKAWKRFA